MRNGDMTTFHGRLFSHLDSFVVGKNEITIRVKLGINFTRTMRVNVLGLIKYMIREIIA